MEELYAEMRDTLVTQQHYTVECWRAILVLPQRNPPYYIN